MSDKKDQQQFIDLYNRFMIVYYFKEKEVTKGLESVLEEINSIKLSTFEPSLELKSSNLKRLYQESSTTLTFKFDKFKIIFEKDELRISFPTELTPLYEDFKYLPRVLFNRSLLTLKETETKLSVDDINKIDEIVKISLMQKLMELKRQIDISSIDIFLIVNNPDSINFKSLNRILNSQIKSEKEYRFLNTEFSIKDKNNTYTIYIEKRFNEIIFFSNFRDNVNWTTPIMTLLDENFKIFKDIMGDLKT